MSILTPTSAAGLTVLAAGGPNRTHDDQADPFVSGVYSHLPAELSATEFTEICSAIMALASTSYVFNSTEQTATGSAQNVAHGLGVTPRSAIAWVTAGHDGAGGAGDKVPTITVGTHGATNCVFTVTAGAKFRVWATR